MNFIDRNSLGRKFAELFQNDNPSETIIVSLKDQSLLTCISMAKELACWVFPLIYTEVRSPQLGGGPLGAYDFEGAFTGHPDGPVSSEVNSMEMVILLDSLKPDAMRKNANKIEQVGIDLRKSLLRGRNVIICCDVLFDPLPLCIMQNILMEYKPSKLSVVIGNANSATSKYAHALTMDPKILDVIQGVLFEDEHYFEKPDSLNLKEKYEIARNISAYW